MRKVVFLLVLFTPLSAFAAMQKPTELQPYIKAAAPYGDGVYSWTVFTAYEAALWTDAPTWSPTATYALSLKYNMSFTPKELVDRSLKEMDSAKPLTDAERGEYDAALTAVFHDVKKGDVITALHLPHKGARFFYNGTATGMIADATLADRFLGIWLADTTSAPSLRAQLLPH